MGTEVVHRMANSEIRDESTRARVGSREGVGEWLLGKVPAITEEDAVSCDDRKDLEEKEATQVLSHWMGAD